MCYLQGSSIGVRMIKTSYFLYSLPMLRQMLSTALSPKKSNFWVLYFGHCLSRTHGGPASSFLNCIWIWVEVIAIIVICKQKLACLQGFANCVLGGLCISQSSLNPGTSEMVMVYLARLFQVPSSTASEPWTCSIWANALGVCLKIRSRFN